MECKEKNNKATSTYRYLISVSLAKEEEITPVNALEDKFLQNIFVSQK